MTTGGFPDEITERHQFVLWRAEIRNGRVTKVPYQLNGERASTTDPATWAAFEPTVWAFVHGGARWSGFGFVFGPNDPYCGVDLDHVIDPATGVIDEQASSIIETLHSYTEYSPSGTGVHVYVKATLPADCRKRAGGIEVYDQGRYFTVTGKQFGTTPDTIAEWDGAALGRLLFAGVPDEPRRITLTPIRLPRLSMSDRDLIDEAKDAANGHRFRALWRGEISAYSSRSEADSALCFMLAFWTNRDPARVDFLFRQSGLMRPKWDEQRGAQTYGELTIRHACAVVDDGFGNGRAG